MFDIEPVTNEVIGVQAQSKWGTLFAHIEAAHTREKGGIFVAGFEKKDAQNLAQSARSRVVAAGLRLRWKQGTHNEREGMFLWLEPDTRVKAQPA